MDMNDILPYKTKVWREKNGKNVKKSVWQNKVWRNAKILIILVELQNVWQFGKIHQTFSRQTFVLHGNSIANPPPINITTMNSVIW